MLPQKQKPNYTPRPWPWKYFINKLNQFYLKQSEVKYAIENELDDLDVLEKITSARKQKDNKALYDIVSKDGYKHYRNVFTITENDAWFDLYILDCKKNNRNPFAECFYEGEPLYDESEDESHHSGQYDDEESYEESHESDQGDHEIEQHYDNNDDDIDDENEVPYKQDITEKVDVLTTRNIFVSKGPNLLLEPSIVVSNTIKIPVKEVLKPIQKDVLESGILFGNQLLSFDDDLFGAENAVQDSISIEDIDKETNSFEEKEGNSSHETCGSFPVDREKEHYSVYMERKFPRCYMFPYKKNFIEISDRNDLNSRLIKGFVILWKEEFFDRMHQFSVTLIILHYYSHIKHVVYSEKNNNGPLQTS